MASGKVFTWSNSKLQDLEKKEQAHSLVISISLCNLEEVLEKIKKSIIYKQYKSIKSCYRQQLLFLQKSFLSYIVVTWSS
jgi:plasmid replication initiation protein